MRDNEYDIQLSKEYVEHIEKSSKELNVSPQEYRDSMFKTPLPESIKILFGIKE